MKQEYDIIIIGSGAGGGTFAYEMAKTGKSILILERGKHIPVEPENWDAEEVFVKKRYRTTEEWLDKDEKTFVPNTHYWVGGNTSFYGAALMRMKRGDFVAMRHCDGVSPAWPIDYDDFKPFYERAEKLWRVHGQRGIDPHDEADDPPFPYGPVPDDDGVAALKSHFKDLGWHPSPLPLGVNYKTEPNHSKACIRCKTCGGFPCMLKAKSDARSITLDPILDLPNVTLLDQFRVERLITDAAGKRVTGVEVYGPDGLTVFVGDVVALAAGAANSAAILLKSYNGSHPKGLANGSDRVGRNYMFHTTSAVICLMLERFNSTFPKTFAVNDFYFGEDDYPYPMGQIQLLEYMAGQTLEGQLAHMIPPDLIPNFISDELARHMVAFLTISEDLPMPDNRVTITRDGQIRLSYTPNNLDSHQRLTKRLEDGLKHLDLNPHTLFEPNFRIDELLPLYGTAHQCGTLRFGHDPRTSVLDVNCKAHQLDNLYAVDTSFFVSSSAVNPTLTTVANAIRVADHLKERLR